jgi:hypothetical protein
MATLNSSNITDGNTIEPTDILQLYDALTPGGGTTGVYDVSISGSLTGSLLGTSSFARTSSFVNTLNQSVTVSGSVLVNTLNETLGQFVGNTNGYSEFSVRNTSTGISASGDIAVYADNGTISNNYIDMGINNSNMTSSYSYFGTDFGNALDAYVYNVGGNLRIGNATSVAPFSQSFFLFSNPTATPNITITGSQVALNKTGSLNGIFDISGSTVITGSLNVSRGITGSLLGTSSFAVSSSRAVSSSFATNASNASNATITIALSSSAIMPSGSAPTSNSLSVAAGSLTMTGSLASTAASDPLKNKILGTSIFINATITGNAESGNVVTVRSYTSATGVIQFGTTGGTGTEFILWTAYYVS